jgi:hypothetical protein
LTRHYYHHYGLTLDVNQALAYSVPTEAQVADVTIEVLEPGEQATSGLAWKMRDPSVSLWRAETHRGSCLKLRYFHGAEWVEFVVDEHGKKVSVARGPTVLLEEAAGLLLGPVFSCVLAQRGLTCVHAAVIAIDGKVIALVGPSGAGKSTTALALVQRGGRLVSDDVAVLTQSGGSITVAAGAPRLKMCPDAARSLLGSHEPLEPTWSDRYSMAPKRFVRVPSGDVAPGEGGHVLDILYVLTPWSGANDEPSLRPLTPAQALVKLMAHRHMAQALQATADQRDFELLARLAEAAPACDVLRPAGLATTEHTVATIVSDVRSHI